MLTNLVSTFTRELPQEIFRGQYLILLLGRILLHLETAQTARHVKFVSKMHYRCLSFSPVLSRQVPMEMGY